MTRRELSSKRITLLALELAMASSPRSLGAADIQFRKIEQALVMHRAACRPFQIVQRLWDALLSGRLSLYLDLVTQQRSLLRMAADDGSDAIDVLQALAALKHALARFELGPRATPTQRMALEACSSPAASARYALLVRAGEIGSTPAGLLLARTTRRMVASCSFFAMVAGAPLLFSTATLGHSPTTLQWVGLLGVSIALSSWLTRGLFETLKADVRAVRDLNDRLKPRQVAGD